MPVDDGTDKRRVARYENITRMQVGMGKCDRAVIGKSWSYWIDKIFHVRLAAMGLPRESVVEFLDRRERASVG